MLVERERIRANAPRATGRLSDPLPAAPCKGSFSSPPGRSLEVAIRHPRPEPTLVDDPRIRSHHNWGGCLNS
eukprot:5014164-Prymnesium_polylepis.2